MSNYRDFAYPFGGSGKGAGGDTDAGGTETTDTSDINLTGAGLTVSQNLIINEVDRSVNLPDATTLDTGGLEFWIKNSGRYAFTLRDNDGDVVAYLRPTQMVGVILNNNATAAGSWSIVGVYDYFAKPVPTIRQVGDLRGHSACTVDSTRMFHMYVTLGTPDDIKGVIVTRSGVSISYGTQTTFESVDVNASAGVFPISTGCALIDTDKIVSAWTDDSVPGDAQNRVVVSTLSGSSISPGTIGSTSDSSKETTAVDVCKLDTDKFLLGYIQEVTGIGATNLKLVAANVSGTAPTFGTVVGVASPENLLKMDQLDTDKAVCLYGRSDGGLEITAIIATVAGGGGDTVTTYTQQIVFPSISSNSGAIDVIAMDSTTFIAAAIDGTNATARQPFVAACTIDGSNLITVQETAAPFGPLLIPDGGTIKSGVRLHKIDQYNFVVFFISPEGFLHPMAVKGTWDTTQFHFTPVEVLQTGDSESGVDTYEKMEISSFSDPNKLCVIYNIGANDSRTAFCELAK